MKKFALLSTLLALTACGGSSQRGPTPVEIKTTVGAPVSAAGDPSSVVAELNGEKITDADLSLSQTVSSQLIQAQQQIYEIKRQGLDELLETRLLEKEAKKRGVTVDQLMKAEVTDKVGEIPEKEIEDFYAQNKGRLGGRTLDELKAPIRQQMFARNSSIYKNNFLDRLKDAADIKILMEPPRVEVSVDDDPMKGDKNAAVTILEFTDYQCPFCGRARPTVKQLISDYGNKIHYVLRDFPLDFHPYAKKAAEAADCAGDQGKYWEYSDLLWQNQKDLDIPDLKKYAGDLKLDQKKFDACLDSDQFAAEVGKDQADGLKAGVNGTPSFFINGRMLTGAQSIEKFKEIIDAELKNPKGKKS